MQEKLSKLEEMLLDVIFLNETVCKAVYDDNDCMFLYPISDIIGNKLEAMREILETIT